MDYGFSRQTGKPVGGVDPKILMDMDDNARQSIMQQMGVANLQPPLPHSPCLKVIKTGVIHPWNELLAAQRDLVVCCDEQGNTDPSAWENKIVKDEIPQRVLAMRAQNAVFAKKQTESFLHPTTPVTQQNGDGQSEYDKLGVISYNDVERLREQLRA